MFSKRLLQGTKAKAVLRPAATHMQKTLLFVFLHPSWWDSGHMLSKGSKSWFFGQRKDEHGPRVR